MPILLVQMQARPTVREPISPARDAHKRKPERRRCDLGIWQSHLPPLTKNKMPKICTIEGCDRIVNARGLCGLHYRRAQVAGEFGTPCSIEGCMKPCVGRGFCAAHYSKARMPEFREQINARQRTYMKAYRLTGKHLKSTLAAGERYRKRNLEKFALKEKIRRAKKRSNGGNFGKTDWVKLLRRFNYLCAYCKLNKATTIDHVIPISKGGTNFIGNILPACVSCNSSKQQMLLIEWRVYRDRSNRPIKKIA